MRMVLSAAGMEAVIQSLACANVLEECHLEQDFGLAMPAARATYRQQEASTALYCAPLEEVRTSHVAEGECATMEYACVTCRPLALRVRRRAHQRRKVALSALVTDHAWRHSANATETFLVQTARSVRMDGAVPDAISPAPVSRRSQAPFATCPVSASMVAVSAAAALAAGHARFQVPSAQAARSLGNMG